MFKKFSKFFVMLFILVTVISPKFQVATKAFSNVSCPRFEVDYIEDNGNFKKISCHNSLEEAKQIMFTNEDYVVRHNRSDSPMKIIAMNHGIAYTYTDRYSDKSTINIYEEPYNKDLAVTYVNSYRDIFYAYTQDFNESNAEGTFYGTIADFYGGLGLEYVDLIPSKFFLKQLPVMAGGGKFEGPYSFIPQRNYYSIEKNGKYTDLVFNYFLGYGKNGQKTSKYSYAIGPAPSFMEIGKKYYSYDGYNFFEDFNCTIKVGTSYNYYQFLPLRTKSKIDASAYDRFLKHHEVASDSKLWNTGSIFIEMQELYGVNAAILFGIAVNESAYGTSNYAKFRNNLFGLNAIDSDPSQASIYSSVRNCVETMFSYYVQSYIDLEDWRFYGSAIGNKGMGLNLKYASDPYWSIKAARYAYSLDKASHNFDGKLTDYGNYDIYLIKNYNVNFKKDADDNSQTLHNTLFDKKYQRNFTVTILPEEKNGYQKIQFTNPIQNGKVLYKYDIELKTRYFWDQSFAYIKKEYLKNLTNFKIQNEIGDFSSKLDSAEVKNDKLVLNLTAYRKGAVIKNNSEVKQILKFIKDDIVFKEIALKPTISDDVLNSISEINLSDLKFGSYGLLVETIYINNSNWNENVKLTYNSNIKNLTSNDLNISFKDEEGQLKIDFSKKTAGKILKTQTVNTFEVNESGELVLDGVAFFLNKNASDKKQIKHELVISNFVSGNKEVIELETYKDTLDLVDGYQYDYVGYRGKVDLDEYRNGLYGFEIKITNGDDVQLVKVSESMDKYQNIQGKVNGRDYRIYAENRDFYCLKIELGNNKINFNEIKKPDRRSSFVSLDDLSFKDGNLIFKGVSLIYGAEFSKASGVKHKLYIVDDKTGEKNIKDMKTGVYEDGNLTNILKTPYDINYSQFDLNLNLENLKEGKYRFYIGTENNKYKDIFNLICDNFSNVEPYERVFNNENFVYNLIISNDTKHLSIEVTKKR